MHSGKGHILVIEDELAILKPIIQNLEIEGYTVDSASDGAIGLSKISSGGFDLIILDLMLPNLSGESILKEIQGLNKPVPTIIVSAKDSPLDRTIGLKHGAVDYITKPFLIDELLIRVSNILKTTITNESRILRFKNETWADFDSHSAFTNIGIVSLSKKEVDLLKYLTSHPNKSISRQEIIEQVWEKDAFPTLRTIDNFITTFRKHFEVDPKSPTAFLSIRGVGYMFSSNTLID